MDVNRAKEIIAAPDMINVLYKGNNIYIENVNEQSGTAKIHSIKNPEEKQEVSITNLIEQ